MHTYCIHTLLTDKMWKLPTGGQWNLVCFWRYWSKSGQSPQQAELHLKTPFTEGKELHFYSSIMLDEFTFRDKEHVLVFSSFLRVIIPDYNFLLTCKYYCKSGWLVLIVLTIIELDCELFVVQKDLYSLE